MSRVYDSVEIYEVKTFRSLQFSLLWVRRALSHEPASDLNERALISAVLVDTVVITTRVCLTLRVPKD